MNITGRTKCFKGKYGYSCSISNKKQDGSYSNMFMQIQLPKGIELEDKSTIEIIRGFISFYENKDGNKIPKIIAMEIKQDEPKQEENYFTPESDSLPF